MLTIKKFVFSPFSENTYIVWDEETGEAAVIDPGCVDPFEESEIETFISSKELKIKYLINTHCHIDHIFGCKFIKEKYSAVYYAPEKDMPLIQHADKQAATFGMDIDTPPDPDKFLDENEVLEIGKWKMNLLFTPGHTPGEYCLYFPEAGFCITGDVLFQNSIGRTDLWEGDYDTLIDSINKKLLVLPDETILYPGHGESTKIGIEKTSNPFLKGEI
jgi:hydroxyacylglutathione hydrolase